MKLTLFLLLFLLDSCFANNYKNHDISLIAGLPEFTGFRYTLRIEKFDIGIMSGILSLLYTQFVDGADFEYCPAFYLGWVIYNENKSNSKYSSHSIETQISPYYYVEDLINFKKTYFSISLRYVYARTWKEKWRFRLLVGPAVYINPIEPDPETPTMSLPIIPIPGIMFSIGRAF